MSMVAIFATECCRRQVEFGRYRGHPEPAPLPQMFCDRCQVRTRLRFVRYCFKSEPDPHAHRFPRVTFANGATANPGGHA